MATKVVWTERSALHLQNIYNYISEDSEIYAFRFVQKMTVSVEQQLSVMPLSGRMVPEFETIPLDYLKEVVYRGYRIIYNPVNAPEKITILAVISARISLTKHFKEDWIIE